MNDQKLAALSQFRDTHARFREARSRPGALSVDVVEDLAAAADVAHAILCQVAEPFFLVSEVARVLRFIDARARKYETGTVYVEYRDMAEFGVDATLQAHAQLAAAALREEVEHGCSVLAWLVGRSVFFDGSRWAIVGRVLSDAELAVYTDVGRGCPPALTRPPAVVAEVAGATPPAVPEPPLGFVRGWQAHAVYLYGTCDAHASLRRAYVDDCVRKWRAARGGS